MGNDGTVPGRGVRAPTATHCNGTLGSLHSLTVRAGQDVRVPISIRYSQ